MLDRFFDLMDNVSKIVDIIVILIGAVGGFLLCGVILRLLEYSLILQIAGGLVGALIGAFVLWLIWLVMRVIGGG